MTPANDNSPTEASNGVSLAGRPFLPPRVAEPDWDAPEPVAADDSDGNCPLYGAFVAGLFDDRYRDAVRWWVRHHSAQDTPTPSGGSWNGASLPFSCRARDELYGPEWSAELSLARGKVYRALGPELVDVVARAMEHAPMAALSPDVLPIPVKKRALAGRLRLGAAFAIICVIIEDGRISQTVAERIKSEAYTAIMALAAKRSLRACNDNYKHAMVA